MRIAFLTTTLLLSIFLTIQSNRVLAQEDIASSFQCTGPEIPVGQLIAETDKFSQKVVSLMLELSQRSKALRTAAGNFMVFSDSCKANQCVSSCTVNLFDQCVAEPAKGCGGEACPRKEIEDSLKSVEVAYARLHETRGELKKLLHEFQPSPFVSATYCGSEACKDIYNPGAAECLEKCQERTLRDHILFNLEKARSGLRNCVESNQDLDFPLSCQEARLNGVLSEKQAQCFNNNFFCCTIRPAQ